MKTLYQLMATGSLNNLQGSGKIASRNVYTSRELAERDIDSFKVKCTNSSRDKVSVLADLNPKDIVVRIIELDLIEE